MHETARQRAIDYGIDVSLLEENLRLSQAAATDSGPPQGDRNMKSEST